MGWGALIGAGVGIASDLIGGKKSEEGYDAAAQAQMAMYKQNRQDLAPYRQAGNAALNAYATAAGVPGYAPQPYSVAPPGSPVGAPVAGSPAPSAAPAAPSGGSGGFTYLPEFRTEDKGGDRRVFVNDYTGDLYRINQFGEYEQFSSVYDKTGNKYGAIRGIETSDNKPVTYKTAEEISEARGEKRNRGGFFSGGKGTGVHWNQSEQPVAQPAAPVANHMVNTGQPEVIPTAHEAPGAEVNTTVATPTPQEAAVRYGGFQTSPGYNFRFDEGMRAVNRNAAARGRYLSGAREKAVINWGQNLASDEFNNYMNRLANVSGMGQTATNAGVTAGQLAAGNAGNAAIGGANARASSYIGVGNTIGNAINNWQAGSPYRQQQQQATPAGQYGPMANAYSWG